ncbi:MAG: serine hydrolase [Candidatus Heimdallarchaeaceae archaeon]
MTLDIDIAKFKEFFEPKVADSMAEMKVPGMSVIIVHEDNIIYERGFGARNIKQYLPATTDTLYGVGSVTKSFTCLSIMQLVEEGKIDVNNPVSNYLPFKLGFEDHPITIHHLMCHSSGVPNLGGAEYTISPQTIAADYINRVPFTNWDDFYLHINGAKEFVSAKPGERFYYFNSGFTLLGEIVAKVSGLKFEEYVKENILKPLKMTRSTFLKEDLIKEEDVATGYQLNPKTKPPTTLTTDFPFNPFIYAPGGLISSVNELAHYLIMNMNGGVFEETKLISTASLDEMHSIQFEEQFPSLMATSSHGKFGRTGYGYGWFIHEDFFGHKLVQHGGNINGASAMVAFLPEKKIGIASLANISPSPFHIVHSALAFLLGRDPEKEYPFFIRKKHLDKLVGEYEAYKGFSKVSVIKKGTDLYLKTTGVIEELIALSPMDEDLESNNFYISTAVGGRIPVQFTKEDGAMFLHISRDKWKKKK